MNIGIAEQLAEIDNLKTKKERIEALQKASTPALKKILGFCFDSRIKWRLPPNRPPFRKTKKEEDLQNVLKSEVRKLDIFVESATHAKTPAVTREMQFLNLLESVDPDDAELLIAIKAESCHIKVSLKMLCLKHFQIQLRTGNGQNDQATKKSAFDDDWDQVNPKGVN